MSQQGKKKVNGLLLLFSLFALHLALARICGIFFPQHITLKSKQQQSQTDSSK